MASNVHQQAHCISVAEKERISISEQRFVDYESLSRNWTFEKPGRVEGVAVQGRALDLDGL